MKNIKTIHNNIKKFDKYIDKIVMDLYAIDDIRELTNDEQFLLNILIDLSEAVEDSVNTLDDNL
jgi:hypothetical protein